MSTDLERLQGKWHLTTLEVDGQPMPVRPDDGYQIIIEGDRFTSVGMGATYEGTVTIHSARKPKALDMLFTVGHATGTRNLGIYKLDGDRWTICLATRGKTRPARFASKSGTGVALETFERSAKSSTATSAERARAKPVKRAAVASPGIVGRRSAVPSSVAPTAIEGEWEMVSGVLDGKPLADNLVKWCKRITRGDVTAVMAGPETMVKARFALDASTSPKRIEYHLLEGTSKGKTQSGIFELVGDALTVCMSAPGKARPAGFSSTPGDGRSFTTWRRSVR